MPTSLRRDLRRLSTDAFDLLVVGGGIYGLVIACDAAQRGLAVALIERNDFGSGTTFNHLRTIHGGLRYLQTLDFTRARESVHERRTLARIAPWAVRPLPFVLPLQPSLSKGKAAMRAGLLLDRMVASDRNDGLPASHHLPCGQVVSANEARERYPALAHTPMIGAAIWHDYVAAEADRLTLGWALAAADHDAVLANYVEGVGLVARGGRVIGADAIDRIDGERVRIHARAVVNATGSRLNQLLAPFAATVQLPLLQAMNLVTTRPGPKAAIGGRSTSGRNLFLVPWRERALFGTWEAANTCESHHTDVDEAAVSAFIADLNEAFPGYSLSRSDVTLVHRGVVPARTRSGRPPTLEGHDLVFEHGAEGLLGLVSVAGTKYTTARGVGERIVDTVFRLLDREPAPCLSGSRPLPHTRLEGDDLLRHAAEHEMVQTLSDAVLRRTPLGALGCPTDAELSHAAVIVGGVLGWSAARQADEIAAVRALY